MYIYKGILHPPANFSEEDIAVFGRHSPESVWCRVDVIYRQAAVHPIPCAGSHGGYTGLPPGGNAVGGTNSGTEHSFHRL